MAVSELPIPGSTARTEAATELTLKSSFQYCMEQNSVRSTCERAPLGTSSSLAVLINMSSKSVEELYESKLYLFSYFSLFIWYI